MGFLLSSHSAASDAEIHPSVILGCPPNQFNFSLSASRQLIRLARSHGPICQLAGWATQSRGGLDFKLSAFDNMGNFRIRLHAHNSQQVRIRISPLIWRNCFLKLAQILQLERVEESMAATSAACIKLVHCDRRNLGPS